MGSTGTSGPYWSLSYSQGTLVAFRQTSEPNGTGYIYTSTNQGANWTSGATLQGAGSGYAHAVLALSSTVIIAQHRGYFYRSTDTGSSFTNILQTSGGQNNFFNISSDGTLWG